MAPKTLVRVVRSPEPDAFALLHAINEAMEGKVGNHAIAAEAVIRYEWFSDRERRRQMEREYEDAKGKLPVRR